jgi:predicted Fe-Mo cluster-binding NifX family protein
MKIAIPLAAGRLSAHFGHCEEFALIDADPDDGSVVDRGRARPPTHAPGALPAWLSENGVELVIAGGIGRRAQQFFADYGIDLVIGAPADEPEAIVRDYLAGRLATGENLCDH